MKRRKMSNRGSKKYFTATASKTHKYNIPKALQRGGYRM